MCSSDPCDLLTLLDYISSFPLTEAFEHVLGFLPHRFYAAEIAVGLFFLHRKGIIYRWVGPREVFMWLECI